MRDDDPVGRRARRVRPADPRRHPARAARHRHRRVHRGRCPAATVARLLAAALPPGAAGRRGRRQRRPRERSYAWSARPSPASWRTPTRRRAPRLRARPRGRPPRERRTAHAPAHRAGQPGPRRSLACRARRAALRPRRCSTRRSAAGCRSRLFQEVREKRGLAYSVYSYNTQYSGAGSFGVYAGCLPGKVEQVIDLCRTELALVAADGITAEELRRGQGQLRGLVRPRARGHRLAHGAGSARASSSTASC